MFLCDVCKTIKPIAYRIKNSDNKIICSHCVNIHYRIKELVKTVEPIVASTKKTKSGVRGLKKIEKFKKTKKEKNQIYPSTPKRIKKLFLDNPGISYTSEKVAEEINHRLTSTIRNYLNDLTKQNIIYKRTIKTFDNKNIAIYNTDPEKIKEFVPDEKIYIIKQYIKKNKIVRAFDLEKTFGTPSYLLKRLIKELIPNDVVCFKDAQYNFYVWNEEKLILKFRRNYPNAKQIPLINPA